MEIMQLMQMFQEGNFNPMQMMSMFSNNPAMKQAQAMMNSGNDPRQMVMNIAKQKGIDENQLKQMAQNFGIKL